MDMTEIRTRFAPSPTGFLHVGGVRTALFAWLVARQSGGKFILRIEDTDQKRLEPGSMDHIQQSLGWLDILWDEGPGTEGPYGPYLQSDRMRQGTYDTWARKLLDEGRAYVDPYTAEEVQTFREHAQKEKRPFLFRDHRPAELSTDWDHGKTLRFKSDPKTYEWHDEVMGDLKTGPEVVDDFVLVKADGYPTYNFAHIVDDADMAITHVIRGQEFLSSMPNYLNLYDALGLKRPVFATMPHIMNEQGNKKLGKRDGAKDILDYQRDGYLPEAMRNFLASLGWNDGTEQEVFTTSELIQRFSLSRVQKSGARFDERRLVWLNGQHIRLLPIDELQTLVADFWPGAADSADESYRKQVLELVQDRLKHLSDLSQLSSYFFEEPAVDLSLITENKQLSKLSPDDVSAYLQATHDDLEALTDWAATAIQDVLNAQLERTGQKPGVLFSLVRIATTWAPFSPQLDLTLELLGRDRTLARLKQAVTSINQA